MLLQYVNILFVNNDFLCGWPYDSICTHELLLCVNPTSFPLHELFIIAFVESESLLAFGKGKGESFLYTFLFNNLHIKYIEAEKIGLNPIIEQDLTSMMLGYWHVMSTTRIYATIYAISSGKDSQF